MLTERDDFLLTMYHADHMRFAAFCDDEDCDRVDYLNDTLDDKEISAAIERYNKRTFGVTHEECLKNKCLHCSDMKKCMAGAPLRCEKPEEFYA